MSIIRRPAPIRMSVLDRLLAGDEPDASRDGIQLLRASVRRDLEMLFNTRPSHKSAPSELVELQTSLFSYGLSDLQTRPLASEQQREAFRMQLEDVIGRFEPRLREVRVEMPAAADGLDRTLRFRIRGLLVTEAGTDAIVYDTAVDPAARNLSITGVDSGGE